MKIRMLQDYTGRETGCKLVSKGEEIEVLHIAGRDLVRLGVAEEVVHYEAGGTHASIFNPVSSKKKRKPISGGTVLESEDDE